ncbi:MAG: hypothetical protein HKO64_02045 [Xanthomonadales bacterium]|nr:hypothetical protein [Xanthomonadales bacterium]
MKLLYSLAVVQLIALGVLIFQVFELKQQAPLDISLVQPITDQAQGLQPAQPALGVNSPQALDETQLRRIIRDELVSQLGKLPQSTATATREEKPNPVSAAEYAERLDLANQQLEYHISQGEISNVDMAELESNIARLDPESRQRMLNLLSQAINSGQLKGHF